VIAAGGIADGRGLAAALALGAVGVWMGTRFIASTEAYCHENYRQKIVAIDEEGTVVTRAASGKPNRQIRNAFTREWEKREAEIQPFPVQFERVGQSAGLIHDVRPAGEIIAGLVDEASGVLARLPR
jgi:enoyl-[acyl-carrier protein] reductase II